MKLTLIETGRPPSPLDQRYPGYPTMFERLLAPHMDETTRFETIALPDGDPLPDPESLDAALITGSPAGVYEGDLHNWIRPLRDWIGFAAEVGLPLVGICYGHQAIADALGGRVEMSEKGWGVGRHTHTLVRRHPAIPEGFDAFSVTVSHKDQVLAPPPTARTLAASDFCPHAALTYTHAPILSFQGHPEFSPDYARALYELRRDAPIPSPLVDEADETLRQSLDHEHMGLWIAEFFRMADEDRQR